MYTNEALTTLIFYTHVHMMDLKINVIQWDNNEIRADASMCFSSCNCAESNLICRLIYEFKYVINLY